MRDLASPGSCHRINVLSLFPSHQECPYIKAHTIPVYSILWIAGFTYWFGIFFLSLSSTCDLTWEFKYPWQISPLKKLICEAKKQVTEIGLSQCAVSSRQSSADCQKNPEEFLMAGPGKYTLHSIDNIVWYIPCNKTRALFKFQIKIQLCLTSKSISNK